MLTFRFALNVTFVPACNRLYLSNHSSFEAMGIATLAEINKTRTDHHSYAVL